MLSIISAILIMMTLSVMMFSINVGFSILRNDNMRKVLRENGYKTYKTCKICDVKNLSIIVDESKEEKCF